MQLNLADGSYSDPCIDINNQLCVNWLPSLSELNGKGGIDVKESPKVLKCTAGTLSLLNLGLDGVRSQTKVRTAIYVVAGNSVYRIGINKALMVASSQLIGTMNTSEGYVSVASNPTQIMWVDGTYGYIYNDSTGVFTQITDPDFIASSQVAFTGGYFFVSRTNSGVLACSGLNDGLTWNALDYTTCAVDNDNLMSLAVSHEELWAIGETSTEIYYNAANSPGFPFSLRTGLSLKTGTQAASSVIEYNNNLYWLDNRGIFVSAGNSDFTRNNNSGYQLEPISTTLLVEELKTYARVDDAVGTYYNDRGHIILEWSFPTAKKTWAYDLSTKQWHQHSYYNTYSGQQEHSLTQFVSEFENLNIASGVRDGYVYVLSKDYPDDNGNLIRRKRTSPCLYNRENFKKLTVYSVYMKIGLIDIPTSGQYIDPQVGLRYSKDGGHNWSATLWRSLGRIGEYEHIVCWNSIIGTGYQWVFEVSVSDPVSVAIIDCWINEEVEQ